MTGGRGFGTECPTLCASLGLKSVAVGLTGRDNMRGVPKNLVIGYYRGDDLV